MNERMRKMGVLGLFGKVAGAALEALWNTAQEANNVRHSSGNMSDRDLVKGVMDKNKSWAERSGYAQAYKDRHPK